MRGFYPHIDPYETEHVQVLALHTLYIEQSGTAWGIHKVWKGSKLHIIPEAAHAYNEPGIVNQIILAADKYARKMVG